MLRVGGAHFTVDETEQVTIQLCKAAADGDAKKFILLSDSGADVGSSFQDERTPLHLACASGNTLIVQAIIDRAIQSRTLIASSKESSLAAAQDPMLLESSSAIEMMRLSTMSHRSGTSAQPLSLQPVDAFGRSPVDEARIHGHQELATLILDAIQYMQAV
jgi:ankyrin repeat protein